MSDPKNLTIEAAQALRDLADEVEKASGELLGPWELAFSDLARMDKATIKAKFVDALGPKTSGIYIFTVIDGPNPQRIQNELELHRSKSGAAFPRLCKLSMDDPRKTLYVGKNETSLAARITDHLSTCHSRTSALKLSEWASNWPGTLKIEVIEFNNISRSALQFIEDHLANQLQTILGKRGSL